MLLTLAYKVSAVTSNNLKTMMSHLSVFVLLKVNNHTLEITMQLQYFSLSLYLVLLNMIEAFLPLFYCKKI